MPYLFVGLAAMFAVIAFSMRRNGQKVGAGLWIAVGAFLVIAAGFAWANHRKAAQAEADRIDVKPIQPMRF